MASFAEIEKLALALSDRERASLAAKLLASLSGREADDESEAAVFKTVRSSMLHSVRYDPLSRFLDVVFRTGEKYRYLDVPPDEYNHMMKAESLGKYMQTHVIDLYETVRFED